jgi:hypothetical protein
MKKRGIPLTKMKPELAMVMKKDNLNVGGPGIS